MFIFFKGAVELEKPLSDFPSKVMTKGSEKPVAKSTKPFLPGGFQVFS